MVAVRLFAAWNPLGVLPAASIGIDVRSLVFAGVVTGAAALMSGIVPALRAVQTDPNEAMRTGGERGSTTAFGRWSQTGMLAAQVAASVVLLVAVVLLVRSFGRLQDEPLGFDVSNITVASLALPTAEFDSGDDRHAFFERLVERLGTLPGVRRTTASTAPLLSNGVPALVQTRASDDETALRVPVQDVTLGYFATLGIPLSAGRPFDGRDGPDARPVAILNESAARLLFGSPADALGRRLRIAVDTWRDVAGVVGDTRSAFFNTVEWVTNPVIYLPARQAFDSIRDPTIRSFALSSPLLFLYSEQFDLAFHIRALEEMLRVAAEVRVFPLLQIGGTPSPHVEGVVDAFGSQGADATVEPVAYEFQRGGNRMLRLRRQR